MLYFLYNFLCLTFPFIILFALYFRLRRKIGAKNEKMPTYKLAAYIFTFIFMLFLGGKSVITYFQMGDAPRGIIFDIFPLISLIGGWLIFGIAFLINAIYNKTKNIPATLLGSIFAIWFIIIVLLHTGSWNFANAEAQIIVDEINDEIISANQITQIKNSVYYLKLQTNNNDEIIVEFIPKKQSTFIQKLLLLHWDVIGAKKRMYNLAKHKWEK